MSSITDALKKLKGEDIPDEMKETALSPIDVIASKSLIDVVEHGAFANLTEEQRQSATFRTGTVAAVSVFELSKAFDPDLDQGEAYRRGATGLISLFEIIFSGKRALDGLQAQDARSRRTSDSREQRRDHMLEDVNEE